MSIRVLSESTPVARKEHGCDACDFIIEALGAVEFSISDMRKIVVARRNRWKIQPGQRYIRQFNTDGMDAWTFKAIPEMHELCIEYDLYPEWP